MINKILCKHKCFGYYPGLQKNPKEGCNNSNDLENKLCEKWKEYVPVGWYGFALGQVPDQWYNVIDEFLDYMDSILASFEIHQIKLKFGGVRFYVSFDSGDEETNEFITLQIEKLESSLFSKDLIW